MGQVRIMRADASALTAHEMRRAGGNTKTGEAMDEHIQLNKSVFIPGADEIALAYKNARLRYSGVSLMKALESPLIYKALVLQARAMMKREQADQLARAGKKIATETA